MKILAIETSGRFGSASVIDDEGRICSAETHEGNDHLKELIGTIDSALQEAGCSKDELTHIAASVGPGSFTGIRIGVTAARTLAQMLDIPCIAVSSLTAMALRAATEAEEAGCDTVAAIINARRHQVYAGAWKLSGGKSETALEESQYMIEELLDMLADRNKVYFIGDGIDAYADIIASEREAGTYLTADEDVRYQHSSAVAGLAYVLAKAGKTVGHDELMPEYMRLAEAEQRLREGTLSDKISSLSQA